MKGHLHIKTTRTKYPRALNLEGFVVLLATLVAQQQAWGGRARLPPRWAGWDPRCLGRRTLTSTSHGSHNPPSDQGVGPEAPPRPTVACTCVRAKLEGGGRQSPWQSSS